MKTKSCLQTRCSRRGLGIGILFFMTAMGSVFSSLYAGSAAAGPALSNPAPSTDAAHVSVVDFLPEDFAVDGSVSYRSEIQHALDSAAGRGATIVFPPMIYAVDESGFRLGSNITLSLYGAVFQVADSCKNDGQVFWGENVTDVQILGGEIAGRNDTWPDGVNIRGIYLTGAVQRIRIRDMNIHDLSSNGIGVFASADSMASDIWVTDVVIDNCCNRYGDYLSERVGPEPGSVREDQGSIAFYYVRDFVVRGCRFENSRSDGTHFYKCRQGQIVDNKIYRAKMGGYFLETCQDVIGANNIILENGSRGVTIERGSQRCTLQNNVVAFSGREGLWAPNCTGLIVTGNIFDRNGRKPNGGEKQIWNANITIDDQWHDPTQSPTQDYIIANNILYTTGGQIAAMRIDAAKATGVVVKNNILRRENRKILVEHADEGDVVLSGNDKQAAGE